MRKSGIPLLNQDDLFAGRALSADFTGKGWRERLGYADTPVYSFNQAGGKLAQLAQEYDFSFFEFWISDFIGHRKDMEEALLWLKRFDQVLGGLLNAWDDKGGLILITSDHGNLEDLSTRRHTANPVPALIIGSSELRSSFSKNLADLTDVAPAIENIFGVER